MPSCRWVTRRVWPRGKQLTVSIGFPVSTCGFEGGGDCALRNLTMERG